MKVAVAGSRRLPIDIASQVVARFLDHLPPGATVMLRAGLKSAPNDFEWGIAGLWHDLGGLIEWRIPTEGGGRAATFVRDVEMVAAADLVLAFATEADLAARPWESGTVHLVDKAIQQSRPCFLYLATHDGQWRFDLVGDPDPTDEWGMMDDDVPTGGDDPTSSADG